MVGLIAEFMEYHGDIIWDISKPDGQPRRMLDTSRARQEFGFKTKTKFEEGLKTTIDWYLQNRKKLA